VIAQPFWTALPFGRLPPGTPDDPASEKVLDPEDLGRSEPDFADFNFWLRLPFPILHPWDVFEIFILRPDSGIVSPSGRQDNAVRHRKFVPDADARRVQGDARVKVDNRTLLHHGDCLQSVPFICLLKNPLEDLAERQGRNEKVIGLFNCRSKKRSIGPIREVLEPCT
jgi:hypothetical protein